MLDQKAFLKRLFAAKLSRLYLIRKQKVNFKKDKQQKTQSQIEINSAEAEHVKGQLEELKIALSTVEAQNTELLADKVSFYRFRFSSLMSF